MSLFVHELRAQQRLFWRAREAAFFTFFLPVIFFLIFGSVYGDETIEKEGGIKGLVVPAGRDDRLRRRRDVLRRPRDHARRPPRVGRAEARALDAPAPGDLHRLVLGSTFSSS